MVIDKLVASINARLCYPWMMKHYEKTTYGKQLHTLKDCFKGKRCFFVGNGPSLTVEDLSRLYDNNEITFAFNRIYNIFDSTAWRPSFYISQDEKMLQGCADVVSNLNLSKKFIPIQMKWYFNLTISGATYFNMLSPREIEYEPIDFSDDIARQIYQAGTVMYTATQLAAYMGFSEIYLIGVDHHFQISQNNKGEVVVDNTVKDYFTDNYNPDKQNLYIPNTEKSTLTYVAMKKHCEQRGIRVFNATRGGKLEVFERVDFDKLFQN